MLRHLRRPIAQLLLPLFLLDATGCSHVNLVPSAEVTPSATDHLVGVTTFAGQDFKFDGEGLLRADTVQAVIHHLPFLIPADSVQRWWLRRSDPGLSLLAGIGIVAGVIVIAGAIAVATKESCPFVYSWDGSQYVFDAEPYGGAITRGLERDDYSPLPNLRRESGAYRLLVTNEVNETQMTNLVELWAVDHAPGLRVLPDERGELHTLTAPLPPASAVDQAGRDLTQWVSADDHLIWEPLPVADSVGGLRDELVLTFPRPAGVTHAKLISRVGTALWGSHMIRALLELRGRQVGDWYAQLDSSQAAADSVREWAVREELYGLLVDVEEDGVWQPRAVLPGSGPFLAGQLVVPLDLGAGRGDSLRLRLRPPRGFWAFNYLAVDYSADQAVQVDTLHPRIASGPDGVDLLPVLLTADTLYHAMPMTGDRAFIEFPAPPVRPGRERTVILHSRGFYHLHLTPTADADTAMVRRIAEVSGAAVQFSASHYRQRPVVARFPH